MAGADHGARSPRRRALSRSGIPGIAYVQGDACALPFADGAFDVVHSNAVIEHVGGRDRQEAFVREALRVGRRVFLTTPNRWFPIEVHTRLPLVHWLPEPARGSRVRPRADAVGEGEPPPRPGRAAGAVPRPGADRQPLADARRVDVSARFARVALVVLVVGLALHNLAMALLWDAGVRDTALDVVAAWKDVLLLVAFAVALAAARALPTLRLGRPARPRVRRDRRPLLAPAAVVARRRGDRARRALRAPAPPASPRRLRPRAAPSARPRLVAAHRADARRRRLRACGLWGSSTCTSCRSRTWRDSGVPGWFEEQLGLAYECLSGLPENWILNTDEESPVRRLVSTFLSPLATAYALVVVLLLLAAARRRALDGRRRRSLVYVGLLWTHTRAAFLALAVGLSCSSRCSAGRGRRRCSPPARSSSRTAFVAVFPTIGPTTTYTATELACLRENAAEEGEASERPLQPGRELDLEPPARAPRRDRDGRRAIPGGSGSGTRACRPRGRAPT